MIYLKVGTRTHVQNCSWLFNFTRGDAWTHGKLSVFVDVVLKVWPFGVSPVLLFCVYTSCFAVSGSCQFVFAFPETHSSTVALRRISSHRPLISIQPPPQEGCRDSLQYQGLLLAPCGTASLASSCYSCQLSRVSLERPLTNVFLFLVSSSASSQPPQLASLSAPLDLFPQSLDPRTATQNKWFDKINDFPPQPLPNLGPPSHVT